MVHGMPAAARAGTVNAAAMPHVQVVAIMALTALSAYGLPFAKDSGFIALIMLPPLYVALWLVRRLPWFVAPASFTAAAALAGTYIVLSASVGLAGLFHSNGLNY